MNPRVPNKSAPTNWVTGGAGATTTGGGGGIMDSPSGNVFNHLSYRQVGRLLWTGLRQTKGIAFQKVTEKRRACSNYYHFLHQRNAQYLAMRLGI